MRHKRIPKTLPGPEHFQVETPLSKEKVRQIFEDATLPRSPLSFWKLNDNRLSFRGTVTADGFAIELLQFEILTSLQFLITPRIIGKILDANHTRVECVMSFPIPLKIFHVFAMCFAYIFLFAWVILLPIAVLLANLSDIPVDNVQSNPYGPDLTSLVLILFVWVVLAHLTWTLFISSPIKMAKRGMAESNNRVISILNAGEKNYTPKFGYAEVEHFA